MFTADDILAAIKFDTQATVYALKTIQGTSGWNSGDAKFAVSLLEQIGKWERTPVKERHADPLSSRQHEAAVKMLTKYAAILARVENERKGGNTPDDEPDTADEDGRRGRWAAEERLNEMALSNNDIPW